MRMKVDGDDCDKEEIIPSCRFQGNDKKGYNTIFLICFSILVAYFISNQLTAKTLDRRMARNSIQVNDTCTCFDKEKPLLKANLNDRVLCICGFMEKNIDPALANTNNIKIKECNTSKLVYEFGDYEFYNITYSLDTLFFSAYNELPCGKNFESINVATYQKLLFIQNNSLKEKNRINPKFIYYTKEQLNQIRKEYSHFNYDSLLKTGRVDHMKIYWGKLIVAGLSGDKRAGKIFTNFQKIYGSLEGEGAFNQEYSTYLLFYKRMKGK